MASCRITDLDKVQSKEARAAVNKLVQLGLRAFCVEELDVALPADPEADGAPTNSNTWRNIRYGDVGDRRLQVFGAPDRSQPELNASVPFGERLRAVEERIEGVNLWLRLGSGTFTNKWVLAKEGSTCNCASLDQWKSYRGRIPNSAFEGQSFPDAGMYTEGYEGSARTCLVSASGDAFWREVNIEMLFRDIATATVFEQQWGGDANFTDWVAYYAGNVLTFGHLRTPMPKRLIVTVKHTSRWRNYLLGCCLGPQVEAVKVDIGKAQAKECEWLYSMRQRWNLPWEQVEFVTAFTFLTEHCGWTEEDCWQAAVRKLAALSDGWARTGFKKRGYLLESAMWCLDEAFERQAAAKLLSAQQSSDIWRMLMSLPFKERTDFLQGAPDKTMMRWMRVQRDTWARVAAECGWREVLDRLLAHHGANLNVPDKMGWTLAHLAAREGRKQVFQLFAAYGANLDFQDDEGRTPAHFAAESGHLGVWFELRKLGADVSKVDNNGMAAKEVFDALNERVSHLRKGSGDVQLPVAAAETGDAPVLRTLRDHKDLDLKGMSGAAPARAAAVNGHVEALRLLAGLGLDLDSQDARGKSLVHAAEGSGQLEVVRLLAEQGADLNLKDGDGEAPVHVAERRGRMESLRTLADKGADLNLVNKGGEAPVHLAARAGHLEALRLLADSRADLNLKDKQGEVPVHLAVKGGHVEALKLLAQSGADVNLKSTSGKSLAHWAACNCHVEALKVLAASGCDLSVWTAGQAPVHVAAAKGCVEALRLLADMGCDLNARNGEGSTPAFCAAYNKQMEALRMLGRSGADLNLKDNSGRTLEECAAAVLSDKALKLLRELCTERGG